MKRKLFSAILLSLIFIFIAAGTVYSESDKNLSVFDECKEYYTESNTYGAFVYGFNPIFFVFPPRRGGNHKAFSCKRDTKAYWVTEKENDQWKNC